MADKSLQLCHCGWSKHTTHQDLRAHQGEMGCMGSGKGLSIPENQQRIIVNAFMPNVSLTMPPFGFENLHKFNQRTVSPGQILELTDEFDQFDEIDSTHVSFQDQHGPFSEPQVDPYFRKLFNQATFAAAPLNPNIETPQLPDLSAADQRQGALNFCGGTMEKPVFGAPQQPLQSRGNGNITRSALNSVIGAQQSSCSQAPAAPAAPADVTASDKENRPSSTTQGFQTGPNTTQASTPADAQQTTSTWGNPGATFTQSGASHPSGNVSGNTSQIQLDENAEFLDTRPTAPVHEQNKSMSAQPFVFGPQPPTARDQNFGSFSQFGFGNKANTAMDFPTKLPQFDLFGKGNKTQTQVSWSTGAPQMMFSFPPSNAGATQQEENKSMFGATSQHVFGSGSKTQEGFDMNAGAPHAAQTSVSKPESRSTQPSFTNAGASPTLKDLIVSDGPRQMSSTHPNPAAAEGNKENKSKFESPQKLHQPAPPKTKTNVILPCTQQTPVGQAGLQTSDVTPKAEHKPVSKTPPATTKPTGTSQTVPTEVSQPGPSTPKAADKEENKSNFETPQNSRQSAADGNQTRREHKFPRGAEQPLILGLQVTDVTLKAEHKPVSKMPPSTPKPTGAPQTVSREVSQPGPATPKAAAKEENKSDFETPQHSQQSTTEANTTRRRLDFSTGAEQAQTSLDIPTTLPQETIMQLRRFERELEMKRKAEKQLQLQKDKIKAQIQHKIRSREQKLDEVQSRVKACEVNLDAEWLEINNVFSEVIQVVEEARRRALQPLENRREKLESDSQSLIKKLHEDIEKLEKVIEDVDNAADLDVASLKKLKTGDVTKMNVDTAFSFGTLQTTISTMMEQIQQELDNISTLELQRAPSFAVDVKLDPTTAHQCLMVSKDGKKVQDGGQSQQVSVAPGRFDMFGSILGVNKFTSGKSYWEVEVGSKSGWDLGVASAKANRKGKLTLKPDNGYWAIIHYEGDKYAALSAPPVCLELEDTPQTVGVFLDYEEGLVSFYNVTTETHIHSFTKCCFDDEICPYFSPHLKQNGQNSEPLVILPVKTQ